MLRVFVTAYSFFITTLLMAQSLLPPDQLYGELFRDVQMSRIFDDSKTFVDCTAKRNPQDIVADYMQLKSSGEKINIRSFVEENFFVPSQPQAEYHTTEDDITKHVNNLWKVLRRRADSVHPGSSLLPLPYDYIVPGGRFREIYYWDSYFTMLGLKESNQYELIESMIKNFAHLISTYGHIPNGNRTYYLSRSQPPFFSLMLDLLANEKGDSVYSTYLPQLQQEYNYWNDKTAPTKHSVQMADGSIMTRYYDQLSIPRQESYLEDVSVSKAVSAEEQQVRYKNLRSAAESGWDFSSRWLRDGKNLHTIETTNLIPVDLNCLIYHLEMTLAKAYKILGNASVSSEFGALADSRKKAILKFCWNKEEQWFVDYNLRINQPSSQMTLAGMFPFFLKIADDGQMTFVAKTLQEKFLKSGGVLTTLIETGEQWDAPNGWAPLQWITVVALDQYNQKALAKEIANRWVELNKRVFVHTGKLVERYDVVDATKPGGGGEYPYQDGFGWSNGVLLAMIRKFRLQ